MEGVKQTTMKALKRIKMFILLLVVIICSCFYTKVIRAEENKIIRVGFPTVSGFTEKKMVFIQAMPMNI